MHLEKQLSAVTNANEKEREEMRRRSFECKVMSEEGKVKKRKRDIEIERES
jgi:hypothetical protein